MRVLERLLKAVRDAAVYNPEVQVPPACILWPDCDHQWEAVIPRLQAELPELLVLGSYEPDKRTGPAIWLRCVIAGKAQGVEVPGGCTPILYLPGVSRQDLRAVETCPDHLKPIAELQYRGVIWSQLNAKDWTILAFLKSNEGGLGLDVAQDSDTKTAMQLALYLLLDEDIELLKGKRLDKDYFNTLLTGGDPVRDLLQWLDQGEAFKSSRAENEWKAFVEVCKSQLGFNPEKQGLLVGAEKLAGHEGSWLAVWDRFCEAPRRYPNIPGQIRKCKPPSFGLFADAVTAGGWPQWNKDRETSLRHDLMSLSNHPPHEARNMLLKMEKEHGARRQLVWAELGEAPLARAIGHLAVIAEITRSSMAGGTVMDLAAGYSVKGWKADDGVVRALATVDNPQDLEALTAAIRAIYLPWAEDAARYLQKTWEQDGQSSPDKTELDHETCLLFVDGLRFDCGKRLAEMLDEKGLSVAEKAMWAALPSVTGTGKPAVAPLRGPKGVAEEPQPYNFEPLTSYQFRKAIEDNGWKIIAAKEPIPSPIQSLPGHSAVNRIWCEFGDIDREGHDRGWKLAKHLNAIMEEIRDRIVSLHASGWKSVRVVTDHGWLLMPGGLPKADLPSALTESKWGRCASLKPGASTAEKLFPWYWNQNEHFALADGVSCFRKGEEYAHGGLSMQECLTLELTVTRGVGYRAVEFADIAWKGMRCAVTVQGDSTGLFLDIRMHAGDPGSSIVAGKKAKPLKDNGIGSAVVEDEQFEGEGAVLVLIDSEGTLVGQVNTVIGGGGK